MYSASQDCPDLPVKGSAGPTLVCTPKYCMLERSKYRGYVIYRICMRI